MAKDKKKKKVDKIKRELKEMHKALDTALNEYVDFKGGTMVAATRSRAAIMVVQKKCKNLRQMIQDKKNAKMAKKKTGK